MSALPACIQLFSARGHRSCCIASLRGTTEEHVVKLALDWTPPRRSYAVFVNLLFRWEHALEFGLKRQK